MKKPFNNYAFIDSQNLNLGVKDQGWQLDFQRFRVYLKDKYSVAKAYLFLGHLEEYEKLYQALKSYGYELIFKPVIRSDQHDVKGNIDAELVLQAMIDYEQYEKAVIVTGDGDFYCLVKYLSEKGKLLKVLVPNQKKHSRLLRKAIKQPQDIAFVTPLRHRLEKKERP
ncbi:NYN domain-containing protein [candidate division KSB1 bacterium]|nr:NYN domain-containing protein [candidate division KSB1 bacterium]